MRTLMILGTVLALLTGCATPTSKQKPALRIGVIPITKTLPLYVAQQEGYFDHEGVAVEIVPFSSAKERDVAMQTGDIDGATMDLIAVALLNSAGVDTRSVRIDSHAMASWAIMVAPTTGIQTVRELSHVPIAISHNTVIEFATEQLLESEGLRNDEMEFTEVSAIPIRMEMLMNGQVQAATLPEPFASLAEQQGARVLVDDTQHAIPPTVVAFRQDTLTNRASVVRSFLRSYEMGVNAINANPEKYLDLFTQKAGIPETLMEKFPVPTFAPAEVPSEDDVELVLAWMQSRDLLSSMISYEKMVNADFLP